jgi:hypothetical protein
VLPHGVSSAYDDGPGGGPGADILGKPVGAFGILAAFDAARNASVLCTAPIRVGGSRGPL